MNEKKAIDTTKMIKMLEFTDKYLKGNIIKMQQAIMNDMKWKIWKDSAKKHEIKTKCKFYYWKTQKENLKTYA